MFITSINVYENIITSKNAFALVLTIVGNTITKIKLSDFAV